MFPERIVYNDTFSEKWARDLSPAAWRGNVRLEFRYVPVEALEHAGCLTDPDVVAGWLTSLRDGRPVPPPVVCATERGTLYVHDGNHRFEAIRQFLAPGESVRVAMLVPERGFRFRRRYFGDYSTYVLEERPLPAYAWAYAMAMVFSAIAVVLAMKAPNGAESPSFVVAVACVLVCARIAGWMAGLLASALTALCTAFFVLPPVRSFAVSDPVLAAELLITAFIMLVLSLVFGRRSPWLPRWALVARHWLSPRQ